MTFGLITGMRDLILKIPCLHPNRTVIMSCMRIMMNNVMGIMSVLMHTMTIVMVTNLMNSVMISLFLIKSTTIVMMAVTVHAVIIRTRVVGITMNIMLTTAITIMLNIIIDVPVATMQNMAKTKKRVAIGVISLAPPSRPWRSPALRQRILFPLII